MSDTVGEGRADDEALAFLGGVGVLAALPDRARARLAAGARRVEVEAGTWLFHEGEPGESLYAVLTGRLEVLDERPPETVIRVLRRGDVVGELAMLSGEPRSASVRASRASELLELDRDRFESLIADVPGFAIALTRALGAQLARSHAPAPAPPRPRLVAVVGLDPGAPADPVATRLAESLRAHGSATLLHRDPGASPGDAQSRIDRADAGEDRVVLACGTSEPDDPWTDLCLREADLVLALTRGTPAPAWRARSDVLAGCELVSCAAPIAERAVAGLKPRAVQLAPAPDELERRVEALARRIAGRAVGVVLSGGGVRAVAHLGVIQELEAAGIEVDRIGAVSLGAIVGGAVASGASPAETRPILRHYLVEDPVTRDYTLPAYAMLRGRKAMRGLREGLGPGRIEELPKRFFCASCDLVSRRLVLHDRGPLAEAVYASLAIPGVFPPRPRPDGTMLVDGGVLDNLPVAPMAATSEGPVIAVDVTGDSAHGTGRSHGRVALLARRALTGSSQPVPPIAETLLRTLTVGSIDTVAAARRHAEVVISPAVDGIGLMQWGAFDRCFEAGSAAAREALRSDPALAALTRSGSDPDLADGERLGRGSGAIA